MNRATENTLIVFGALVGLAFILVGGIIAMVYSDGQSATIVLPLLLAQVGPLIVLIMSLAKGIENGSKADIVSTQVSQIPMTTSQLVQAMGSQQPQQPQQAVTPVVVNVPQSEGGGNGPT